MWERCPQEWEWTQGAKPTNAQQRGTLGLFRPNHRKVDEEGADSAGVFT